MKFDRIAQVYDVIATPENRLAREGPFLEAWIKPQQHIIDLACGTGIHAEFLARKGALVTACDLSPAMIDYATAIRPHRALRYLVSDMRTPPVGPYHKAMILGNSLNLLPDRQAVRETLHAIRLALMPQGRLLLQLLNPDAQANTTPKQIVKSAAIGEQEVLMIKSMVPKEGRRFITLTYFARSLATDYSEPHWESDTESAVLLDLKQNELQGLAEASGMRILNQWGGMDGSLFKREQSQDLIIEAEAASWCDASGG